MSTLLDAYNKIDNLLKKLYLCTEKEEIDVLFEENGITDYTERSVLLHRCMGFQNIHSTPDPAENEDLYNFDVAVFVDGTWRFLD